MKKRIMRLTENDLHHIIRSSVEKILKEDVDFGGGDEFEPHGYRTLNNYGGNEIQVSNSGDAARLRLQSGEVTDWFEIEFDEEGVAYIDTPQGREKLSEYMRY